MTTDKEFENAVEVSCEVLLHDVSTDEFREAVEDAVALVKNGGHFGSFDERGREIAQVVREASLEVHVTVVPDGMGTAGELVDALFQIAVVHGPISIAAYDVWKHLILPQLQERWGRQALIEKRKESKRARKAAEKLEKEQKKAAKKLEQKRRSSGDGDVGSATDGSGKGKGKGGKADLNETGASLEESSKKVKKIKGAEPKANKSKGAKGAIAPEPKRKAKKPVAPTAQSAAESVAPAKKKSAKVQK